MKHKHDLCFEMLSQKRTQLMGVATLMIIVCHASASNVLMPYWLQRLFGLGNFGVDLFLLLSGLGVFYSLSKDPFKTLKGGVRYYKRRIYRIFIPYLLVYIPFCFIELVLKEYSLSDCFLCLGALEFWFFHRGAWFVSLIGVLYLLSPLLYKMLTSDFKWLILSILILLLMILCNIPIEKHINNNVVYNFQFAFSRAPSFLVGMSIGSLCKDRYHVNYVWLIILFFLGWSLQKFFQISFCTEWLTLPLVLYVIVLCVNGLSNLPKIDSSLKALGEISLESYLTNICINYLLITMIPSYYSSYLFYGRYLEYLVVIVAGLLLGFYINILYKKIISVIN